MRVLVTYGSRHGGTGGLARAVGDGLVAAGHAIDVLPADQVDALDRWDAVVLGGALYGLRWHPSARRFARRHVEELLQRPVWCFSSGPLNHSTRHGSVPPTGPVQRLMNLVGARSHRTFGGRLLEGIKAPLAARGDFRDLDTARAWGQMLGHQLSLMPAPHPVPVPARMTLFHQLVLGLCLFTGITAVLGGIGLLTAAPGSPALPPASLLEHSPFDTFFIPGLVLLLVVGGGNLLAALLEARRLHGSELAVLVGGAALTGWIVTQVLMVQTFSWLQLVYFLTGVITLTAGWWLWRVRHRLQEALNAQQVARAHWRP